jgi:hypothetical protein
MRQFDSGRHLHFSWLTDAASFSNEKEAFFCTVPPQIVAASMKYIFDTNIFRDIQGGAITPRQVVQAKARIYAEQSVGCVAPIVLLELGSHIVESERQYFVEIRDAFRAIRSLCSQGLCIPEEVLRTVVFGDQSSGNEPKPQATLDLCLMVASAECFEDVYRPRAVAWDGGVDVRAWNKEFLGRHRQKVEQLFIDMVNGWVAMAIPDHIQRRERGEVVAMRPGAERDSIIAFYKTPQHYEALTRSQAIRVKANICDDSHKFYLLAAAKISAYLEAITYIMREVLISGYNITKHKNDLSDIHFLAYLADPEVVLVTSDRKIKNKIPASCSQASRIVSASEWFV